MDHAERARAIADEVLFPRASQTDAADLVPRDLLDVLADAGLYGMAAPVEAGGWGLPKPDCDPIIEALASGCLTTTFVWIQHHNVVRAVAGSDSTGGAWLARLASGEVRAGISRAGERAGAPALTATPATGGGWVLDGVAPWLTGWGRVDVVLAGARHGQDEVVRLLIDAEEGPGLTVTPLRLAAANASGTVRARFEGLHVAADRLVEREPLDRAVARDPIGLRTNGSLALGVASRCASLMRSPQAGVALTAEVVAARARLDSADVDAMPAARAAAAGLAWRAAGVLAADHGARAVTAGGHPERLAREALFVLVFGSRPSIRDALLADLTGTAT
jgi:alkylation response protein AidB-like acyl-CoA dehydrogenase